MAKKLSQADKKRVEDRLVKAKGEIEDAKRAVENLPSTSGQAGDEYTAAEGSDPGGKPCGRMYDAQDSIEIALLDLGGRPCGGGRPC